MHPFDNTANPQQFDPITLKNIDSEPFEVMYDGKSYGLINPGEIRRFPRFLAEHALKHLLDQTLNNLKQPTNHPTLRPELSAKIFIAEESLVQPIVKTQEQILKEQIVELNQPSDLDLILTKQNQLLKDQESVTPTQAEPTLSNVLEQLPAEQSTVLETPESDIPEPINPAPPVLEVSSQVVVPSTTDPAADAERAKLFTFAKDVLKIDIDDEKTKAAWQLMSNEDLARELNYEEL